MENNINNARGIEYRGQGAVPSGTPASMDNTMMGFVIVLGFLRFEDEIYFPWAIPIIRRRSIKEAKLGVILSLVNFILGSRWFVVRRCKFESVR